MYKLIVHALSSILAHQNSRGGGCHQEEGTGHRLLQWLPQTAWQQRHLRVSNLHGGLQHLEGDWSRELRKGAHV